ncbi:flavin reductase family protein [Halorubrum vacuolatum]|uniref:NADH-FMN oxidoreductase RutF, flavin reductase (DIM6/NTAB) family n=1 Tax=Halorubrum vacuolatum TaxID=63740 RepID=A0A238UXV8_HALVU|nr:flavin reductase family protein [Halorubrum vacuolatum]SNR26163.1 NADH-FMN oxidoreductase RutF, flavin reductase (DIM6/NTAB) family [Halorubrum vacuolatum]
MRRSLSLEPGPDVDDRIIKTAVAPRPIAWVSTVSDDGVENLAPFSSYNYVSSSPPVLVFNCSTKPDGELKDTPRNALDTGEFVVNVVTEDLIEAMDLTATTLPADESEFDHAGIEHAPSDVVTPPRVAAAAVSMECTLYDSLSVYDRTMVLGEVVRYHVAEDALTDGKLDSRNLPVVGRLGGPYYTTGEPIAFERR